MERLTRVLYPDGSSINYVYDNAGNRLMDASSLPGESPNQRPAMVGVPGIPNAAVNVSSTPLLTWQPVADPDVGDAVVYFVYFGATPTPQLVYGGPATNWSPGQLGCFTTYNWYVVAKDSHNAQTSGPLWTFTTGDVPPHPDFSADLVSGLAPLTVTFRDQSRYECGVVSGWQWDCNNDGQIDSTSRSTVYRYSAPGDYSVRLIATGEHGGTSTLVKTNFISVLGPNIVDLAPLEFRIESAGPNQNLLVSYLVTNAGTISLSGKWQWADGFYLSQKPVWDATATQVGSVLETLALPKGAAYRRTNMVSLSSINPAGQYLFFKADDLGKIPEISENNNILSIPASAALPDLVVGAVRVQGQPVAGQFVDVAYSVTNRGTLDLRALSGAGVDCDQAFYVSTNAFWDNTATLVGFDTFSGTLAAGGSFTRTNSVSLPALPAGSYFLLVRANHPAKVLESDKTNNTAAERIVMSVPDLAVISLVAPERAASDDRIDIVYAVTNQGSAPALDSWFDSFYLSTNSVWDEKALELGFRFQDEPVPVGGSYTGTNPARLPGWPPGTYYLFVRADSWGVLSEPSAANNILSRAIDLTAPMGLPDLQPGFLNAPDSAPVGSSIQVSYGATNAGGSPLLGQWFDVVWLAATPVVDSDSDMVGAIQMLGPLASHAAYSRTNTAYLGTAPPGRYFLILETDYAGLVDEVTTTNNFLARPFIITAAAPPDLAVRSLTAPASAAPGQTIQVSYSVTNQGGAISGGSWFDNLSLSKDNVVGGADDVFLSSVPINYSLFAAGASYTRSVDVIVPELPAGNYYFALKLDYTGNLNEATVANNTRAVPVLIRTQEPMVRFTHVQLLPDDRLEMQIEGQKGNTYTIMTSTNLVNWDSLSVWTCTNSPAQVVIPRAPGLIQSFYRLSY